VAAAMDTILTETAMNMSALECLVQDGSYMKLDARVLLMQTHRPAGRCRR